VDTYCFRFNSLGCLAVYIASCFLFQTVQSQPADLILNGREESPGFVWILKRFGATAQLMKFFAFDRKCCVSCGSVLRGMGAYGKGLVARISIYLQLTCYSRILLKGGHGHARNFGAQLKTRFRGVFLKL